MKRTLLSLMLIPIVMLAACALPGNPGGATLVLRLAAEGSLADSGTRSATRTILPVHGVAVSAWEVRGSGPYGLSFSATGLTGAEHSIANLAPGAWTVTAKGYDAGSALIVQSAATPVTLEPAAIMPLALSCGPLAGSGTFNLSLALPVGAAVSPVVSVTLAPLGSGMGPGITLSPDFGKESEQWKASATAAPEAGWYNLSIRVTDGAADPSNNLVWAFADSIRILKGRTTLCAKSLDAGQVSQADNSGVTIATASTLSGGLGVYLTPPESVIGTAGGQEFTAGTAAAGTLVWRWYLDGTLVENAAGTTWTVPAGLRPGSTHWITAIAYRAADGANLEAAGSDTEQFTVAE